MAPSSPAPASPFRWPAGIRAAVSLSFDDARLSQVDRGLPILDAHGVKATFYVSPRAIGQRIDGWRAAVRAGHEIGNHTLTHPCSGNFAFARANPLEEYTLARMEQELLSANEVMRSAIGVTPTTFAYPCGQTFVGRGAGLQSYVPLVARHFIVGRAAFNEIHNDPVFCDLAQITSLEADGKTFDPLKVLVDRTAAEGGWLVLFGHEVGDGGRQTTVAGALDALCRYCRSPDAGIWIDTVAAVGRHIQTARRAPDPEA